MIIIYGHRPFGRVDEHGGEYAQTSFAHIYYMPLFPTGSFWVTRRVGSQNLGLSIGLHGKSVAAAYLRTWVPLIAIIMLASSPGFVTALVAAALGALSLTSLTWTALRSHARRRSDFNLLAFGTRCEPALVKATVRAELRATLEERWAKLDAKQPPDDVARFGAANLDEAVIAYGLLRLAAIEKRSSAEHGAADRLLAGSHEALPEGEGPYRGGATAPREAPALHDEAAAVAAKYTAARTNAPPAPVTPWWKYRGSKPVAVILLAAISLGGILENLGAITGPVRATGEDFVVQNGMIGSYVDVTCDDVSSPAEIVEGVDEHVTGHIFGCVLGDSLLAVKTARDVDVLDVHVEGKVHTQSDLAASLPDSGTMRMFLPVYVDVDAHGLRNERIEACIAGAVGLFAIGLGLWWLRAARRRKRAASAAG